MYNYDELTAFSAKISAYLQICQYLMSERILIAFVLPVFIKVLNICNNLTSSMAVFEKNATFAGKYKNKA